MIKIIALLGVFLSLLFGILAILTNFKDQQGKITKIAVYVILGIFFSGILSFLINVIKDQIATSEKEQDMYSIFNQIYLENSRLNPDDIKIRLHYICMSREEIEEKQFCLLDKPGWVLAVKINNTQFSGDIKSFTTMIVHDKDQYHGGAEHSMEVYSEKLEFSNFELGKINKFIYPQFWDSAFISIDFNGTDRAIFNNPFVLRSSTTENNEIIFNDFSICGGRNDIRSFIENEFAGKKNELEESEYIALLPVEFNIDVRIRGISVASSIGFIYQIQDANVFRMGREKTISSFSPMQITKSKFPELQSSRKTQAPNTILYIISLLIISLCSFLAILIVINLAKKNKTINH